MNKMPADFLSNLAPYVMVAINIVSWLCFIGLVLFYKFIYPRKTPHPFIVVFVLSFLPLVSLVRSGVPDSIDFTLHTVLTSQFYASLLDGNLSPQWADGAPGGFGYPAFVFMYQLPYYLASIFKALGFGLIETTKLVLASAYLISCVSMYLWAKDEFGRWGAAVAVIFYQFTAYHLIITHTFTSFGETVAFAVLPLPFWSLRRFILTRKYRWFAMTSICYGLCILSHQALGLVSLPILIIYALVLSKDMKRKGRVALFASYLSLLVGILLTAHYWLPLIAETRYIQQGNVTRQVLTQPFIDFIYSPWGFGFLYQGEDAKIKWVIGYAHWLVVVLVSLLLIKRLIPQEARRRVYFYLGVFSFLFVIMQPFANPVWSLPLINNFRWTFRLMSFESFFTAALAGVVFTNRAHVVNLLWIHPIASYIYGKVIRIIFMQQSSSVKLTKRMTGDLLVALLCFIAVTSSILHWANRIMLPKTSEQIRATEIPVMADLGLIPIWLTDNRSYTAYIERISTDKRIEVLEGKALITELSRSTTKHSYNIQAETSVTLKENTAYFPG